MVLQPRKLAQLNYRKFSYKAPCHSLDNSLITVDSHANTGQFHLSESVALSKTREDAPGRVPPTDSPTRACQVGEERAVLPRRGRRRPPLLPGPLLRGHRRGLHAGARRLQPLRGHHVLRAAEGRHLDGGRPGAAGQQHRAPGPDGYEQTTNTHTHICFFVCFFMTF